MNKESLEHEFAFHELDRQKPYFEGWYYKVQTAALCVGVVVGIHQIQGKRRGFIQVLNTKTKSSCYLIYEDQEIQMRMQPFQLRMGKNEFTRQSIHLHEEAEQLHMDVQFHTQYPLHGNHYMPTIMGPFSYFPMECVHSIISLHHHCEGTIQLQETLYDAKGIGYMEKDRGTSFPKRYLWFQSNICQKKNSCFFLSVADIPFHGTEFQGMIAVFMVDGKQKRFATYLGGHITKMEMMQKKEGIHASLHLVQGFYEVDIHLLYRDTCPLKAPVSGDMRKIVKESLNSIAKIVIYHHHKLLGQQVFQKGGCEISGFYG